MVSTLDSGSKGPHLSPGHGHCVEWSSCRVVTVLVTVLIMYSHSVSLHPGEKVGTGKTVREI